MNSEKNLKNLTRERKVNFIAWAVQVKLSTEPIGRAGNDCGHFDIYKTRSEAKANSMSYGRVVRVRIMEESK